MPRSKANDYSDSYYRITQKIELIAFSWKSLKCSFPMGPTPAVWPKGETLPSAGGPCLSGASWSALRRLASVRSNEARRGVNGLGPFCRNKRASPAGAKTGNTGHHVDTRVGDTCAMRSPRNDFLLAKPMMDSQYTSVKL